MFLNYFGMNEHPFMENPPIEWLLNDGRFEQGMARLDFFKQQGNIALILGQTGIGKSSLLRRFIQSMPQNRYHPLYIHLTQVSPSAFLRLIVTKLGEQPRLGKDRLFLQITDRICKAETESILIIDEAHLLASQSLTDLRLLSSHGIDSHLPMKIIFSAQESFGSLLKRAIHADLRNRISIKCHLQALSKTETVAYIDHRLKCSGASEKILDSAAKEFIHDYAGGVPRQINNITTACLINAASRGLQKINEELVNETMAEFSLP